jgi:NAD(P)-dependent dehydrogenase (short-subunit alcohol dehydrogenase family)
VTALLEGKVAIVTGSGHGIGRGHALELARHGAAVLVNDLGTAPDGRGSERGDAAEEVAALIRSRGGRSEANHADVGDASSCQGIIEQAIKAFGRLDVLVNNAGFQRRGGVLDASLSDWEAILRVHLLGTFNCLQAAARHWAAAKDGPVNAAVINTTSPTALGKPTAGIIAYVSAKAGVAALTRAAAVELAPLGIRVNAISPTGVTRMSDYFFDRHEHVEPDQYETFDARDPSLNAPAVAWLASDLAAHVSGEVFEIRAGRVTHMLPWSEGGTVETAGRWEPEALGEAFSALAVRDRMLGGSHG